MKKRDLYWLAGLLEGEGSFMRGPPSAPNQPRISVEMTDRDVIRRVAKLLGLRYVYPTRRSREWKRSYKLALRGFPAVKLMTKLRPMMGKRRRKQIDAALESFEILRKCLRRKDYRFIRKHSSNTPISELASKFGVSERHIRRIAA